MNGTKKNMGCDLSIIIPARDENDQKLRQLLRSIQNQDFDEYEMEALVITEGTSESAKAIGIRRAQGQVVGFLASDNELVHPKTLKVYYEAARELGSASPAYYFYSPHDDVLNRYFSLIGGNDPLSFYMRKNDRGSYMGHEGNPSGTIGDNGFFIVKSLLEDTDLDHYYHIDNALEACGRTNHIVNANIWHHTGGNIFKFFYKRYCYGLQHAFNKDRRWHLVDFNKPKDIWRLIWFVLITLTLVEPLMLSLRGYRKVQDVAWFIHPVACFFTLVTYTILMTHLAIRKLFQSLFAHTEDRRA